MSEMLKAETDAGRSADAATCQDVAVEVLWYRPSARWLVRRGDEVHGIFSDKRQAIAAAADLQARG